MTGNRYAPIIVFAYNRPKALRRVIESLLANPESKESDLFVFIDGARHQKAGDAEKVKETVEMASNIDGFKSVTVRPSEQNKGLAKSIIGGTTEIINQYGRVIVLEDDLRVLPNFLCFMNQMLDKYADEKQVFQISGYTHKMTKLKDYPYDMYFHFRARSWSWGTWKDRWETVDWEVKTYPGLCASKALQAEFNKGGSDLFAMLKGYMEGRNNSWWVRFNYAMHLQGKLCVMPFDTLVSNEGFGADATHCTGFNRYPTVMCNSDLRDFRCKPTIEADVRLSRQAVAYYSIPYRAFCKIMDKIIVLKNKRLRAPSRQ